MTNCDKISLINQVLISLKSEVNIMCKKLDKLNNKTAQELLKLLGDNPSIPINIDELLKTLSIKVSPYPFSKIEKQLNTKDTILGMALVDDDDIIILYREGDTENRKRFTIAHELAHCCLNAQRLKNGHIELRSDQLSNNKDEYAANVFAGELLIPRNKLEEEYLNMVAPLSDVLAKTFGVSTNVMEKRLEYLKMPYYRPIVDFN